MDETALCFLLDQNIPIAVSAWLKKEHPEWIIHHVNDKGLEGSPDNVIFEWAQENDAIVITYDEDFADSRSYSLGKHHGVIRLRVWPTTIEKNARSFRSTICTATDRGFVKQFNNY
jgi:predicted nuclease of predicted toxin-antitoxin system